jgi:hypothetical protein
VDLGESPDSKELGSSKFYFAWFILPGTFFFKYVTSPMAYRVPSPRGIAGRSTRVSFEINFSKPFKFAAI